jgi:hypothetical protein
MGTWDREGADGELFVIIARHDFSIAPDGYQTCAAKGRQMNVQLSPVRLIFVRSQERLDEIARQLNQRPRKTLRFETPQSVLKPVLRRPTESTTHCGHSQDGRGVRNAPQADRHPGPKTAR